APYAPRLTSPTCAGEAFCLDRAVAAQPLGFFHVCAALGEPQVAYVRGLTREKGCVPARDRLLIRRRRSCGGCGGCWLVEYPRVLHGVLLADGSDGRTVSPWHPQRRANMKKATDLQGSVAARAAEGRYIRPESEPGGRAPALLSAAGTPAVRGRVSSTSAQMLIPIPGRLILNSFFMLCSPPQCSANRVSPAGRSSYRTGTNNTLRARPDRAKSFSKNSSDFFRSRIFRRHGGVSLAPYDGENL